MLFELSAKRLFFARADTLLQVEINLFENKDVERVKSCRVAHMPESKPDSQASELQVEDRSVSSGAHMKSII